MAGTKPREFLDGAYDLEGSDATRDFYGKWAETYEEEIRANGYVTPRRCAEALRAISHDDDDVREVLEELVRDDWLRVQIIAAHSLAERREEKSVGVLRSQAERRIDHALERLFQGDRDEPEVTRPANVFVGREE